MFDSPKPAEGLNGKFWNVVPGVNENSMLSVMTAKVSSWRIMTCISCHMAFQKRGWKSIEGHPYGNMPTKYI